jgi:hydroxymethylpyrimidine/phosphomethylpyrimidine kinase
MNLKRLRQMPIALTIAGSDSGGGAGIQADLKTFAALGVHGTSVITCLTAQNPKRVRGIHACPPSFVQTQLKAIFEELPPAAVKTGMLYSAAMIRAVAEFLKSNGRPRLVVDPVMVATSGARLIAPPAVKILQNRLLPMATLVTPNLPEAEVLIGKAVDSIEGMRWAAKRIREKYGCATLVKGGHLRGLREAVDIYYDGEQELLLSAPFVRGRKPHGTGCTYSAAITAFLAKGFGLSDSVGRSKEYISQAIAGALDSGGHIVLNWL